MATTLKQGKNYCQLRYSKENNNVSNIQVRLTLLSTTFKYGKY